LQLDTRPNVGFGSTTAVLIARLTRPQYLGFDDFGAPRKWAVAGQKRKFFQAKDRQVIVVTNSARCAQLRIGGRPQ
jgi:hypothetical protein